VKVNVLGKDSVKRLIFPALPQIETDNSPMKSPAFAFAGSPLNRRAEWRSSVGAFTEIAKVMPKRWLKCRGDQVAFAGDSPVHDRANEAHEQILLGEDRQGVLWFASPAQESDLLLPLRGVMMEGKTSGEVLAMLAQARSLLHWHETHGFCAACGAKSEMVDLGYRRHCPACGRDHFPRTDPVVIMVVRHGEKFLLGRQASWQPGMYSALAGFMEPGETIEEAVAREVREEAGIEVTSARYVASQPWPFPSSLMIGMIAEAIDDTITLDGSELEDARWFDKDELELMLTRRHPDGFHASHPYAIAHHIVQAALADA
jgi:NADH pyrophosphatase NudC (nudix superfamily)